MELTTPWQKIVVGSNLVLKLKDELEWLGISKPLIVCSPRARASDFVAEIKELVGIPTEHIFDNVLQHSNTSIVDEGAKMAVTLKIDGLIAVGGASASDTAKGIAIVMAEGGSIEDHASTFIPPRTYIPNNLKKPKIPLITFPTTASAGEITPGAGITNSENTKLLFWDPKIASRAVFYDINQWLNIPDQILNTSLMNAIAHNIEGMYSQSTQPISQAIALESMATIDHVVKTGLKLSPDFEKLPMAVAMSGMVISNARVGIHHAICHCIGSISRSSHGEANSVMLPHALKFNKLDAMKQMAKIEEHISKNITLSEEELAENLIKRISDLQDQLQVSKTLKEIGVTEGQIEKIALKSLSDRGLYFNPREVTDIEEIKGLLIQAF